MKNIVRPVRKTRFTTITYPKMDNWLERKISGTNQIIYEQAAINIPPIIIYGWRRPQRLRVLSLTCPMIGSKIASQTTETAMAMPAQAGFKPRAFVKKSMAKPNTPFITSELAHSPTPYVSMCDKEQAITLVMDVFTAGSLAGG